MVNPRIEREFGLIEQKFRLPPTFDGKSEKISPDNSAGTREIGREQQDRRDTVNFLRPKEKKRERNFKKRYRQTSVASKNAKKRKNDLQHYTPATNRVNVSIERNEGTLPFDESKEDIPKRMDPDESARSSLVQSDESKEDIRAT